MIISPRCTDAEPSAGADVHEKVAPFSCLATVWTDLFGEKAFKVGFWMKFLKYLGVEIGHVHCELEYKWGNRLTDVIAKRL